MVQLKIGMFHLTMRRILKLRIPLQCSINKHVVYGYTMMLLVLLVGYNILGTSLKNSDVTKGHETKNGIILLVIIMSKPSHSLQRYFIRKTWAIQPPENTLLYFTVGTKDITPSIKSLLEYEHQRYNDLLLIDNHTDTYQTLTQKMLETYKIIDRTLTFDYVLKVDEDAMVNLETMKRAMDDLPKESIYIGFFKRGGIIIKNGKNKEMNYKICDKYLPYAFGGGYALSRDVVRYIAAYSHRLRIFANEDVSVGTWLAPLDIAFKHDIRFRLGDRQYGGCSNFYMLISPVTIREMIAANTTLHKKGQLCFLKT